MDINKKRITRINKDSAHVRFIMVEYDISDDEPQHTDTVKFEPALKDTAQKVGKRRYPELTDTEISAISEFSEGNASIALAETASHGDSLANLKDHALLLAAKALPLVYTFNGKTPDDDDAELP